MVNKYPGLTSKEELLGLSAHAPDSKGRDLKVGSEVLVTGKIIRIHKSGFMLVQPDGACPQPPILLRSENTEEIDESENGEANP